LKLKKSNYKIRVLSKAKLNNDLKSQIFELKKTHYHYSLKSQKNWFQQNINPNDKHLLLFMNDKIIGYNLLRIKKLKIYYKHKIILQNCYLFDTLILNQKYRNRGLSKMITNKSNLIIKDKNYYSFLLCLKKLVSYYRKFHWNLIPKNKIMFTDHVKTNKKAMFYGKDLNLKKIIKIRII
jgi:hypothetical protein